jgi:hypothetical protein
MPHGGLARFRGSSGFFYFWRSPPQAGTNKPDISHRPSHGDNNTVDVATRCNTDAVDIVPPPRPAYGNQFHLLRAPWVSPQAISCE